jgi:sarcosine oxidase
MKCNANNFETIVIGLGAMGSAAVYQLSKKGNKVLGIDQFAPPHTSGSSHGDTRITRQAIGEGEEYVSLSLRSYEIWNELEKKTGKQLLTITGGLIIGDEKINSLHGSNNFLQTTIDSAKKFNISHSLLFADELRKRFPQFHVEDNYIGYYEEQAGFLRPELCITTQIELARQLGAQINLNEKVQQFKPLKNGSVEVRTNKSVYTTHKLIVSAGPWMPQLFAGVAYLFKIYRQVLYWFDIKGSIIPYLPELFPIFIMVANGGSGIYGFPAIDGPNGGVKVAFEDYSTDTSPESVNREVNKEEIEQAYNKYIAKHLPGLSNKCIKATSCLYTVTPDSKFIIDTHPAYPQIIIASPCSGHGFKHSAAIGEALSELATEGKSHLDLSAFKVDRFTNNHPPV